MIWCFPLVTARFCLILNTPEGMKRRKFSAFSMQKYLFSLESSGNPVCIQLKTQHNIEKAPITLYFLSLIFNFFHNQSLEMESQYCSGQGFSSQVFCFINRDQMFVVKGVRSHLESSCEALSL